MSTWISTWPRSEAGPRLNLCLFGRAPGPLRRGGACAALELGGEFAELEFEGDGAYPFAVELDFNQVAVIDRGCKVSCFLQKDDGPIGEISQMSHRARSGAAASFTGTRPVLNRARAPISNHRA